MADCHPNQRFNRLIAGGGVALPGIDVGAAFTGCCAQSGLTRRPVSHTRQRHTATPSCVGHSNPH